MSKDILTALYENKRLLVLKTFLDHPTKVEPSLAFAYEHRLAPIFHEDIAREVHGNDPYADVYAVKADFMKDLLKYVDENSDDDAKKKIDFYTLEDVFGGRGKRMDILFTLEYARINRRFNDSVYAKITNNAPVEGNEISKIFEVEEVYFS